MADHQEIRIDPGNPLDVEDLAAALRGQFSDTTVTIAPRAVTGWGVTAWEVLNVFVPWSELPRDAFMAGVGIVAKEAIAWAHRRLKTSPHRPKFIAIYGINGEILKAVRVDPGGEEIDMTKEQRQEQGVLQEMAEKRRTEQAP